MSETAPKYDVAISFLSMDEPLASKLHHMLSAGLKVFFFPRNQEELAGTDGLESMRRPFMEESRLTVVVYRSLWGNTPWTRVEEAAVKDGCLKYGWERLFFLCLDDDGPFPVWLPHTHVRFSFKNYGIEQAVGAIKARVQERGGEIVRVDAQARARLIHAEAVHLAKKQKLFGDMGWITSTARPFVAAQCAEIVQLALKVSNEVGMKIRAASKDTYAALTNNQIGVRVVWNQAYTNVLGHLEVSEVAGQVILPDENLHYSWGPPSLRTTFKFELDLSLDDSPCWREAGNPSKQYSSNALAEKIVGIFLDFAQDFNQGKVDTTSEFERRLQDKRQELDPDWRSY